MSEKVLVVDDEKDICKVLAKILELAGYEVRTAYSGTEALSAVSEYNPELVFLDFMLPDITGLDVLRGIKSYSDDIYVVMVTGRGSEEVAASVMKAGASDYIIKPFAKDQILTVARDTIRIRTAEIATRSLRGEVEALNRDLEKKVELRTRELVETQERLVHQQNLASLGEMSGGMAHEIKNPLNSISLFAQLLLDDLPPNDPSREYLEKILQDVERVDAIVTNLSLFSRRIKRDKAPVRLDAPLDAVIRTLHTQFSGRDIKLVVDVEKDLPEVLASREEMEEVFSHLLINSMHAIGKGGEIDVRMRLLTESHKAVLDTDDSTPRKYIEVSVKDTGIGITPENISKVFIPFFTTKTDWDGTGLGLSVVHRVITDHRGTIDVVSETGKGAQFIFRIPVLESGAGFGSPPSPTP